MCQVSPSQHPAHSFPMLTSVRIPPFPHTYGHQAASPNSVHSSCKLQTLGPDSRPGCVVCTWEVGSEEEVSRDLEEWAWGHLAGIPQGCSGLEKKALLLSYRELCGCPGKARLRFFLLLVRNKIAPIRESRCVESKCRTAIHHVNMNGLRSEFLLSANSGHLVDSLQPVLGCL